MRSKPEFPERFGSIEDARAHCRRFFQWYNHVHRHSGIALMTPETVHFGTAAAHGRGSHNPHLLFNLMTQRVSRSLTCSADSLGFPETEAGLVMCVLVGAQDPRWQRVIVRDRRHLNNIAEQDHCAIKRRCASLSGFESFKTAAITLAGAVIVLGDGRLRRDEFKQLSSCSIAGVDL